MDGRVLEAMLPWLSAPANPHSVQNEAGLAAERAVNQARAQLAKATGKYPQGIVFTPSATFACNQVIRSFARSDARIVVSAIEHPCVMETARVCETQGASLEIIPVNEGGVIDLDAAYDLIADATFVSVMAVNNEVGTIQPIAELAQFCNAQGAVFHTDAAQALGRIAIDELDPDAIITLSGHKVYGPQGIGAICASPKMLALLQPLITGGGQQDGLYPGTIPTALTVGFGAAAELAVSERTVDWAHCARLSRRFVERLRSLGCGFVLNGDADERVPHNLNLSIGNIDADALLTLLPRLALATGSACSSRAIGKSKVLGAMGLGEDRLNSAVRIGFGKTSLESEIDEAADLIANAISRLPEGS